VAQGLNGRESVSDCDRRNDFTRLCLNDCYSHNEKLSTCRHSLPVRSNTNKTVFKKTLYFDLHHES